MAFNVIITGASGMVGEGVLLTCLSSSDIASVLVLGRRSCGHVHPKLKELLHSDFHDISNIESELQGFDACFFCLGVSSVGLDEEKYRSLTYDLTMHVAQTLSRLQPSMTFCYVSGAGTDSTERGRSMWARVKGKTENDLMQLPFSNVFAFRPGFLEPVDGMLHALKMYRYVSWSIPLLRRFVPKYICSLRELGLAMIHTVKRPPRKKVLEVTDIVELAAN